MFSTWLEAFALAPQVYLLVTGACYVDESAAHFAGLTWRPKTRFRSRFEPVLSLFSAIFGLF